MATVQSPDFEFFSVAEVAEQLGLTDGRIRQMLGAEEIKAHKLGEAGWAIPKSEVDRLKSLPKPSVGRPRSGNRQ